MIRSRLHRYDDVEAEYRDNPDIEVVLVSSDSLATIRKTHGNYFRVGSVRDLDDLVGVDRLLEPA